MKDAAKSDLAIQAQDVLDELSADPEVRLLVQRRELAQMAYRLEISAVEDRGLRTAVLDLCEVLGIVPTDEQHAELERLDRDGLNALRARLKKDHRWE